VTLAVGLAVALAGTALGAWAVPTVGDQSVEHPGALITDGPYASTRNPM
jgi:protein-S-isoprenylcysteine O-methyltransferase Ste14